MSKANLTAAEWELVKDAPLWVNAVLAAAEKGLPSVSRREAKAVDETLKGYRSSNALIREILADDSEPAAALKKASKAEAEVALGRIASIVESKMGADDLDALNELLLMVGRNVASAANEGVLGLGSDVSKKEAAALKELEVVLRASDAQKKARQDNARKEHAQTAAAAQASTQARQEAEAKAREQAEAKAEQARKDAQAKAKAEQERKEAVAKDRIEKTREEAEARRKDAEAKERLEKARAEAEARQKEAQAHRETREREEQARAEATAKEQQARAEAEAKAAAEKEAAAARPRFTEFIAEHTVVAGDNLSFISQKYYGHQGNFRLIYEANKDVIGDNMSLIRPGQKLRIPKL